MELVELLKFGTPVLVLGMLIFLERINAKVTTIQEDIKEIKQGMTWQDTCHAKHEEINRRLAHLERKVLNSIT